MTIRLMLTDDHTMFREALAGILGSELDFTVVAQAAGGDETLLLLAEHQPDILLLDMALPDLNGVEVARQVCQCSPATRTIVLSGYADPFFLLESLRAQCRGYVLKSSGATELIHAIRAVHAGHIFLSPEVTGIAVGKGLGFEYAEPRKNVLTPRENEVLYLIASGDRSAQIAVKLGISLSTVDVHRRNIRHKLGMTTTAELTRYALREGIVKI